MRSFFDTNVLVYLFDAGAPEKQARSRALLHDEVAAGRAILSTQVVQEFYVTVTRKLARPLAPDLAHTAVEQLCALPLVTVNTDLIKAAIGRNMRDALSFWDALIVETALSCAASTLWSEDMQHGQRVEGLTIKNPFA